MSTLAAHSRAGGDDTDLVLAGDVLFHSAPVAAQVSHGAQHEPTVVRRHVTLAEQQAWKRRHVTIDEPRSECK